MKNDECRPFYAVHPQTYADGASMGRGGACPSQISQGKARVATGRASHGPYEAKPLEILGIEQGKCSL